MRKAQYEEAYEEAYDLADEYDYQDEEYSLYPIDDEFEEQEEGMALALESTTSYTVKSGDNLSSIASRFGTTVNAIVSLNGLANANSIRVGQVLQIPSTTTTSPAPTCNKKYSLYNNDCKEQG